MGEGKEDRRVIRTRQLLRDALVGLILERGFDAITVQDILDRANLGRSTFYAHFRNKEDLLFSGFEYFLASLHASPQASDAPGLGADFSLHMFRHVAEMRRLIKALVGRQGSRSVIQRIETALGTVLRRQVKQLASEKGNPAVSLVPLDIAAHYVTSSFLALLTLWLDGDLPYTAEEMDAMYKQLTMPGLVAALGLEK
jgi:AcrR family transcriptional regulator